MYYVKPPTGMSERPKPGGVYKPTNRFAPKEKKEEAVSLSKPTPVNQKPQVHKLEVNFCGIVYLLYFYFVEKERN